VLDERCAGRASDVPDERAMGWTNDCARRANHGLDELWAVVASGLSSDVVDERCAGRAVDGLDERWAGRAIGRSSE
jgi:hypothetical protein